MRENSKRSIIIIIIIKKKKRREHYLDFDLLSAVWVVSIYIDLSNPNHNSGEGKLNCNFGAL